MKNLVRYDPFEELFSFNQTLNKLFSSPDKVNEIATFAPSINTREGDHAYHIEIDLPGIKKEEVNINVEGNTLNISGERKFKNELSGKDYYKVESSFGKFLRRVTLPENIDLENIDARYGEGVLEIVLPKIARNSTKKIEIKSSI